MFSRVDESVINLLDYALLHGRCVRVGDLFCRVFILGCALLAAHSIEGGAERILSKLPVHLIHEESQHTSQHALTRPVVRSKFPRHIINAPDGPAHSRYLGELW